MANRYLVERLNPQFGYFYTIRETLHRGRTSFQDCEVVDTEEFGRVLLLDGITQVGERNEYLYHEPMVHPALTSHPDPCRVCVIGGGDGGIVREVLRHRPERVVHVELDGGVVETCRSHLPSISQGCWERDEVELVVDDGRKWIETTDEPFDVVIMDMTDPFGPSTMLYTREFFQAVKRRLADARGLFVMHAESPMTRPRAYQQICRTLAEVWSHQHLFYVYIEMYATLWAVSVSCDHDAPARLDIRELATRLGSRGIGDLRCYTPATHHAMQVEFPFISELRAAAGHLPAVTDQHPRFVDEIDLNREHARLVIEER